MSEWFVLDPLLDRRSLTLGATDEEFLAVAHGAAWHSYLAITLFTMYSTVFIP